jgi:hypothetical protein
MHDPAASRGLAPAAAALTLAFGLAGCQSFNIHDAARSATASGAKTTLATVDTATVIKTEQENLDRLLTEELKSLQTRARIDSDLALLEIADNEQSVARHYTRLSAIVVERFGTAEFGKLAQGAADSEQLKADRASDKLNREALTDLKVQAPPCKDAMPDFTTLQTLPTEKTQLNLAKAAYSKIVATCARISKAEKIGQAAGGELQHARNEADTAAAALAAKRTKAQKAKLDLDAARKDYDKAVAERKAPAKPGDDISKQAKTIEGHLKTLEAASPEAAKKVHASAIADVLSAAAGGTVDTTDKSKELASAIVIARRVPSLANTIAEIEKLRSAPTVSNLVLALNHEVLAAELDARLASLSEEEIRLLQEKVQMLESELALWRTANNQLCNLVLLSAAKDHPSLPCGAIAFKPPPVGPKDKVACTVTILDSPPREETVSDCILSRSWKNLFQDKSLTPGVRRALYEAAIAYLNARIAGNRVYEYDFKVLHQKHRSALAIRESALRQWNNVVSVPVEQLDAYYASGIKPAQLADFLVKALGLTAIAIGVAQ